MQVGSYADVVRDRKPRFVSADEAKHVDIEEKTEGKAVEDDVDLTRKVKFDENELLVPDAIDEDSQEETPIPTGDDVEILKGGYHQVYVVLKDPGAAEEVETSTAGSITTTRSVAYVLQNCEKCYSLLIETKGTACSYVVVAGAMRVLWT